MKKKLKKVPKKIEKFTFAKSDIARIRKLIFMGIIITLKRKQQEHIRYKVWVKRFSHIWAKSRSPISAYRKLFKILREKGVYLP